MKYIIFLAFIGLCACGADGAPERPLSLVDMRAGVTTN